jgi:deoxyribonuclease-4
MSSSSKSPKPSAYSNKPLKIPAFPISRSVTPLSTPTTSEDEDTWKIEEEHHCCGKEDWSDSDWDLATDSESNTSNSESENEKDSSNHLKRSTTPSSSTKKSSGKVNPNQNLGFHISRGPQFIKELQTYRKLGYGTFQIFISSPHENVVKKDSELSTSTRSKMQIIQELTEKDPDLQLFLHAPYTINPSNPYDEYGFWNQSLLTLLERAEEAHAKGVVIHMGKYKELSPENGTLNMVANLSYVLQTTKSKVPLLLETPAGQGTELGVTLSEFAAIWKSFPKRLRSSKSGKMGICADTCHLFAAGYNLRDPKVVKSWLVDFDRLIGLKHLKLIHLNDSKENLGSHLDRHAPLLRGKIGDKLGLITHTLYHLQIPIIVETPSDLKTDQKILTTWTQQKS